MAEKKSVLTLNLGSQRVGMARFGIGGKGALVLKDYAFVEVPGDPTSEGTRSSALTAPVAELTAAFKAADDDVNYAIPGHVLMTKFVKLPPLAEDQVDKIVGFEAQQAVPFPLNETVWDYQLMGKHGGEVEVGIVAVRSEQSGEFNVPVSSAKLVPHIVDAAPIALYNAFRYNYPSTEGCSLLLDMGARTTNLVFIEGRRAFISTVQVGSASLTQSIAKEMECDFGTAEHRKVTDGFVNLGGNYADHEDAEIDAMSKILRNALTRIHGEITRRINLYRQQQGGSAPTAVYLAGGGASLPFVKEYWEEKLRIPVHYFNALQAVGVGPRVDTDKAGGEAHMLGELVGLALREMACPMEVDLAPVSVKASKDLGSRKPMLMTAAAALAASLLSVWGYNKAAAANYSGAISKVEAKSRVLEGFQKRIMESDRTQAVEEARMKYLTDAVRDRGYLVSLMNTINNAFPSDKLWITQWNAVTLKDGSGVTAAPLYSDGGGTDVSDRFVEALNKLAPASEPPVEKGSGKKLLAALQLKGILQAESQGDADLINGFFDKLASKDEKSPFKDYFAFDPSLSEDKKRQEYLISNNADVATKDGISFEMVLPLAHKVEINLLK